MDTDTLIDLDGLNWPALRHGAGGLEIAATCRHRRTAGLQGASRMDAPFR